MNTINGQCTRVSSNKQEKKGTENEKPFPIIPITGLVILLLFWVFYSVYSNKQTDSYLQYYSTDKGHAQRMLDLEIQKINAQRELEEARAKSLIDHAQIVIPSPFPTRGE